MGLDVGEGDSMGIAVGTLCVAANRMEDQLQFPRKLPLIVDGKRGTESDLPEAEYFVYSHGQRHLL